MLYTLSTARALAYYYYCFEIFKYLLRKSERLQSPASLCSSSSALVWKFNELVWNALTLESRTQQCGFAGKPQRLLE